MLTMLGWHSTPLPLGFGIGKRAQLKAQKQATMPYVPKTIAVQPVAPQGVSQSAPLYKIGAGSYVLESQRPPVGYPVQHLGKSTTSYVKAFAPTYICSPTALTDGSNVKNGSSNRSFKILPSSRAADVFIYERSEDARSDTLTSYSSSSETISLPSPPAPVPRIDGTARRPSLTISNTAVDKVSATPQAKHPHSVLGPLPVPSSSVAVIPHNQSGSREIDVTNRARSGGGDSGSRVRKGSISDSERSSNFPPGSSPTRASPPRNFGPPNSRLPERPITRDILPMVRQDSRMQVDMPRPRRLSGSGPVIPPGYGPGERQSPPNNIVPTDPRRERYLPDRDLGPVIPPEYAHERRASSVATTLPPPPLSTAFCERDRPRLSHPGQSLPRERQFPQDEVPRSASFAAGVSLQATVIRSRTISSSSRKECPPRPIIITDPEMAPGPSRTVRFSERLICPSPIPLEKRRKGWFNRKGDQLWTNDGVFVPPDMGTEYPIDLVDYPDAGAGWMNEEGIRIDIQHRLIPKTPLRPALKRSNTSGSSGSSQQSTITRPGERVYYSGITIRGE